MWTVTNAIRVFLIIIFMCLERNRDWECGMQYCVVFLT